jgi:ABC-2 type transport system ATP-binding protein
VGHLTKQFGRTRAVDDVSFTVERGEIVGFLGPNGAGKTTLMRILACFIPATGGRVNVGGLDVFRESLEVRRRIGYLPESIAVYPHMRVGEYLRFRAAIKGLKGMRLRRRVDDAMSRCGLVEVSRTVIGRLSRGYRQRLGLADSLVHDPEILILDEPTLGLDPNQIRHIRGLIKSLGEQHTVLLSSHILPEVEMICGRVLILNRGRIVASGEPGRLIGLLKGNTQVVAEVQAPADQIEAKFAVIPGVLSVALETADGWQRAICECEKGTDLRPEIHRVTVEQKWPLRELSTARRNLEDVFVSLTTSG